MAMKRTEAQSVGQIFEEVLHSGGSDMAFRRQRACFLWPEIVGQVVNRRTYRRYVDGDTLHVYISSGPMKSELEFAKSALLRRLNEAVGAASDAPALRHLAIH